MRQSYLVPLIALALAAAPAAAQETVRYFPAAASTPGLNGTFFSTDAVLFNPDSDVPVTVYLSWLPGGSDNSAAAEVPVTILPRTGVRLEDLVGQTLVGSGAGGVRMRADAPFLAVSRTFNNGKPAVGTFGQTILSVDESAALQQGLLLGLVNDPSASGFRSNVGFLNVGLTATTVTVKVWDAGAATLLGQASVALPPRGFSQSNVFALIGQAATAVANATVEFTATGPVLGYLSLVENTSGDAIFVVAVPDSGTPDTVNRAPEGAITTPAADITVTVGDPVSFVASASDPDGDEVTGAEWIFGDGETASGLTVTHTYTTAGTFSVTFTATDVNGLSDPTPAARTVTVQDANRAPEGTITQPVGNVTVQAGAEHQFAATVSDPDGDQVISSWDFGDDVTASGLNVAHIYAAAGVYTVTFTATDSKGSPDPTPDTRTITVEAAPPATLSQVQAQIFTLSCAVSGCHRGASPPRGMNLEAGNSYSNIVNVASVENPSLNRIEPENPDASYMWLKVNGLAGARMPLGGPKLSDQLLALMRSWIEAGAPNN